MSKIREVLEKAEKIKPMAVKNGKKIVTFEEAITLADAEGYEPTPNTSLREYDGNGNLKGIRTRVAAINPDSYFANRYKVSGKVGHQKMSVVVDWRAIHEQNSGRCYLKHITAYVFARTEKYKDEATGEVMGGELYIEKVDTVSDTEFISDYTNTLDNQTMAKLIPLIDAFGTDVTTSELPI